MSRSLPSIRSGALPIDTRPQLFIDERFIAWSAGVTLTMNPPVQHPEPVLVSDRP